MVTNLEAAKLYRFLKTPAADQLVLTLKGNLAVQEVLRNTKDFYESVTAIEVKHSQPSEAYQEYLRKRDEYISKHAAKDTEGNPIVEQSGTRIADVEAFNADMEVLMSTCRETIEEHQHKLQEWQNYLTSPYDGKISIIKMSDVEINKLSKEDFESFKVMIEEFQEKPENVESKDQDLNSLQDDVTEISN